MHRSIPLTPKRSQPHFVKLYQPDVLPTDESPLLDIRIYPSYALITRQNALIWESYPVSPQALADSLTGIPQTSGLLAPNTLAWGRVQGQPMLVCLFPPRMATIRTDRTEQRTYQLPLPPLVFGGCRNDYRIWALNQDTYPGVRTPLCVAPFPNSYKDGSICWGNVGTCPAVSAENLKKVLRLFLEESLFNAHVADGKSKLFPVSILAHWNVLDTQQETAYPLDDLVPTPQTLDWLCEGGPWIH